jgi:outer membrane protein TolC
MEDILQSVLQNNTELKAYSSQIDSKRLGFKTGLTPANPEVEYENSFSSAEGKPYEITISQAFDFPTSYIYRHQISKDRIKSLEYFRTQKRQEILLETQLTCLEMIFLRKKNHELVKRAENAQKLFSLYKKRLEEGDATILDFNKVKMAVVNTSHRLKINSTKLVNLEKALIKLNGNQAISFKEKDYNAVDLPNSFSELSQQLLPMDPVNLVLQNEQRIAQKEISLSKAEALPKWSIGYRFLNSDLGKSSNGLKLGLSIPLWENRNKVRQSKQNLHYLEQNLSVHQLTIQSELEQLYLNCQSLKQSLQDYKKSFAGINTTALLTKAVKMGEISSIEYFMELSYYYDSYDAYLEVEQEYHKTVARLKRFSL